MATGKENAYNSRRSAPLWLHIFSGAINYTGDEYADVILSFCFESVRVSSAENRT